MATPRKLVFGNEYVYHVYNRGLDQRTIFSNKRAYERFILTSRYYRHQQTPFRYSKFIQKTVLEQDIILRSFVKIPVLVEILAYCLMPNHFHFILRQKLDNGIPKFISLLCNSFAKYFNTRLSRVGPLFPGPFKAVVVETDGQLIHLSRYIHLNPVVSALIKPEQLDAYPWSSFPDYMNPSAQTFVDTNSVLAQFPSREAYKKFVYDQIDYARQLEVIKHQLIDG